MLRARRFGSMFEALEYREQTFPTSGVDERLLGIFEEASDAVSVARERRALVQASGPGPEYVWWVVKRHRARVADWIADSRSSKEFVLDLRSGRLVEV
jgi:hypothetical protein